MRWLTTSAQRAGLLLFLVAAAPSAYAQTAVPGPAAPTSEYYHQPAAAEAPVAWPQGAAEPIEEQELPQEGQPTTPAVEKSRKLSYTYEVAAGKPYSLETRYGRVQVNTWNRKEIRTDVDIITRADTEDKAQQLQDMIEVQVLDKDPATGGISARSRFGLMPRACWSKQRLYEVNYTIWLPKNTPLKVCNTFGEVSVNSDLSGPTDLSVQYGVLRTGRLEGTQNALHVSNGRATVLYAHTASLEASYSRLRLVTGQTIDLRNNYSDIDIGTVQDLTVHSKYGDVVLGTVHKLRGSSGYSKFSIDKLGTQLDMTVQYCPAFEVRTTGKNFRQITLKGGYSTILLNFADGTSFNFDVNTDHGKLLVDKEMVKVASKDSSGVSSDTQGQFGLVQTKTPRNVNIRMRYGNVSFNK